MRPRASCGYSSVLWSLLAWIGYSLVDPVLGRVAGSAGLLVDGGKGPATAVGAGKEVGAVVDNLNVSGFLYQRPYTLTVMPALVAGIHVFFDLKNKDVDGRNKSGRDAERVSLKGRWY